MLADWPGAVEGEATTDNNYPVAGSGITHCAYLGNFSGTAIYSGVAGVGISLQETVELGTSVWVSGNFTNVGTFYGFNTATSVHIDVRPYPISVYDVLQRFGKYASALIHKEGIKLVSTHTREWASVEEPEWKQLIMDFEVEAPSDAALALWDDLSDELGGFLTAMIDTSAPNLRDLISITVQWK